MNKWIKQQGYQNNNGLTVAGSEPVTTSIHAVENFYAISLANFE